MIFLCILTSVHKPPCAETIIGDAARMPDLAKEDATPLMNSFDDWFPSYYLFLCPDTRHIRAPTQIVNRSDAIDKCFSLTGEGEVKGIIVI